MISKKFLLKTIIFLIFSYIFSSFILGHGYWAYLDAGFEFQPNQKVGELYHILYSVISINTGFGFDNGILGGSRFFADQLVFLFKNLFGSNIGRFFIFILFFLSSFNTSYYLLKKVYKEDLSFLGALFFTFNPISLYFLSQTGFIFSYFSGLLFILSVVLIVSDKKIYIGAFLLSISLYLLISYPRILGIYALLFVGLFLLYRKYLLIFVKTNYIKVLKIFLLTILTFSSLIVKIYYSYGVEKKYFSGVGNYATSNIDYGAGLYHSIKSQRFGNFFNFTEITSNFQNSLHSNNLYLLFQIIFVLYFIIIILFYIHKYKEKKLFYLFVGIFLFIIFLKGLAKFVGQDVFTIIYYKYYPFIANNSSRLNVLIIICLSYIIPYSFLYKRKSYLNYTSTILVFIFFFTLIFPFINNSKLNLIENKNPVYKNTFYNTNILNSYNSIFLPSSWLYTNWASYPINPIGGLSSYKEIFTNNTRLVNSKQSEANNLISKYTPYISDFDKFLNDFLLIKNKPFSTNIESLGVFNLKNIFVFKDLKNAEEGEFDFFPSKNYVKESKFYYQNLKSNSGLYIKQDNENFAQFGLKNDKDYEYFLYSPRIIKRINIESFFSGNIDILEKPIIIDPKSFNKSKLIDSFSVPKINQNIYIGYKKSVLQPTKIYAKLGNLDTNYPFLIQLNQTFGVSWKLKFITKEDFDEKNCIDDYKSFSITQNKYCNYKPQILDIKDTKYLKYNSIPDSQHFEGNFVGNTWLINPSDIPESMKGQKELYAVIIYEKQIWYNWALIISGTTFLILILLSLLEYIKSFKIKKSGNSA